MKSILTVVSPSSDAPLIARERDGLEEHLGQDHGRAAVQVHAAFEPRDVRDEIAEVAQAAFAERGARRVVVHVNDVGADGDVDGDRDLAAAPAAARTLTLACAGCRSRRRCTTAWPSPSPSCTPSLIAAFSSSPGFLRHAEAARARALRRRPRTSLPDNASSKSWMTPAPLVASAETKPRSIRSISTGDSPVLITCAPMPQMMPRSAVARRAHRRDHRLEIAPRRE